MTNDLGPGARALLHRLDDAAPAAPPFQELTMIAPSESLRPRGATVAMAAGTLAVLGFGLVALISRGGGEPPNSSATTPASTVVATRPTSGPGQFQPFQKEVVGLGNVTATENESGQICVRVVRDSGAFSNECALRDRYDIGHAHGFTQFANQPDVLAGVAPLDASLVVTVGTQSVSPDDDGFWWVAVPDSATSYVLATSAGETEFTLVSPVTTSTVAATG